MELKELTPIVVTLILVGMVLGVGILVMDYFADAVKTESTIVNESLVVASATGTLANDDLVSISLITNLTTAINCTSFNSALACANWTNAGVVTVNGSYMPDATWLVTYVYDSDTEATTVAEDMRDATAPIGTTWLTLIVTVLILSIILTLVIKSFTFNR